MKFEKAERKKAKLRLALTGPSGSGKTYGALQIAKGLGGKVAMIDTEKGSGSLYSDMLQFDVLELGPPFTPERFTEAVKAAEDAGYDLLIIDSITHEWSGKGGCLELVDEVARAKYKGNSWSAWNDITPRHRDFLDALLRSPLHIIATMRSKTETAQTEEGGRKRVVKLGMKAEQRDGAEYEFTTVLDIVHDGHYALASKDRTGLFTDKDPKQITPETGKILLQWLAKGEEPAPAVAEPEPPNRLQLPHEPITPASGVWENLSEERQKELTDQALIVAEYVDVGDVDGACDHLKSLEDKLSTDEKVAMWSLLDSKIRTAIKKRQHERKREAQINSLTGADRAPLTEQA